MGNEQSSHETFESYTKDYKDGCRFETFVKFDLSPCYTFLLLSRSKHIISLVKECLRNGILKITRKI